VWFLVPGLSVSLALWCTGSPFAMDFPFVSKKRKDKKTKKELEI
jgi:hypothetical protein